jgi:diguanylate cyclase (GGDEF)-like protein
MTPVVEKVPASAAVVAVLSLVAALVASLWWPESLHERGALVWMLAITPFLLLAHFKAWRRTAFVLGLALLALAAAQFLLVQWLGMGPPDPLVLGFLIVSLVAVSFYLALLSQSRFNDRASTLYLAGADPLTGLHSADVLRFFLDRCFAAARRGRPLSIAMFDMDGLSAYAERYGSEAADQAVQNVADILDANTRAMDMSGRFGEDEFLALLPGGSPADAFTFAVRVRKAVESSAAFRPSGMTVSAGVASYTPGMETLADLLGDVTAVTLAAHEAGGNRVMRSELSTDQVWVAEATHHQERDPAVANGVRRVSEDRAKCHESLSGMHSASAD